MLLGGFPPWAIYGHLFQICPLSWRGLRSQAWICKTMQVPALIGSDKLALCGFKRYRATAIAVAAPNQKRPRSRVALYYMTPQKRQSPRFRPLREGSPMAPQKIPMHLWKDLGVMFPTPFRASQNSLWFGTYDNFKIAIFTTCTFRIQLQLQVQLQVPTPHRFPLCKLTNGRSSMKFCVQLLWTIL